MLEAFLEIFLEVPWVVQYGIMSFVVALLLPISCLMCATIQGIWRWIDDSDEDGNWVAEKLDKYVYSGGLSDSELWGPCYMLTAVAIFSVLLAIKLYMVSLVIAVAVGVAFTARFTRRLHKRFNVHAEDREIHNQRGHE